MKHVLALLSLVVSLVTGFAAAPPPPGPPVVVGAPTNGFWITNVTFVFTNTAVRTPTIDLGQVTIYNTNVFAKSTVLAWTPPTNSATLGGYRVYYGPLTPAATNTFNVNKNITSAAFYSSMANTNQWWAYVTAVDTNNLESIPSNQILFTPK